VKYKKLNSKEQDSMGKGRTGIDSFKSISSKTSRSRGTTQLTERCTTENLDRNCFENFEAQKLSSLSSRHLNLSQWLLRRR